MTIRRQEKPFHCPLCGKLQPAMTLGGHLAWDHSLSLKECEACSLEFFEPENSTDQVKLASHWYSMTPAEVKAHLTMMTLRKL